MPVTTDDPPPAGDRFDELRRRLDDPAVAAALGELLDHADLLAVLVTGLDGLISRSEVIGDSLAAAVGELRTEASETFRIPDPQTLSAALTTLSELAQDSGPALWRLITSDALSARSLDLLSLAAHALIKGHERTLAQGTRVSGVRGLIALLRDRDLARGLGLLVEIGRALGRGIDDQTASPARARRAIAPRRQDPQAALAARGGRAGSRPVRPV